MKIKDRSLHSTIRLFHKVCIFFVCLVGVAIVGLFFLPKFVSSDMGAITEFSGNLKQENHIQKTYFLQKSPFFLKDGVDNFSFPRLNHELVLLSKNTRPDFLPHQKSILVSLKSSLMKREIHPFEKVFLKYDKLKSTLVFSDEKTPLWISIYYTENDQIEMKATLRLEENKEGSFIEKEKIFPVKSDHLKRAKLNGKTPALEKPILLLYQSKFYMPDQLFEKFGGENFEAKVGKPRLKVSSENSSINEIAKGDLFIYDGSRWRKPKDGEKTLLYPLAQIIDITEKRVEIQVFDISGQNQVKVYRTSERIAPIALSVEKMFSKIKQKTHRLVSLYVQNKNMILKKGDWILYDGKSWKVLSSKSDIEKYLSFELEGHLLIYHGICEKGTSAYFSGSLFDPMRVQAQEISLPLVKAKKIEQSPSKKRVPLRTMESASMLDFDEDDDFDEEDDEDFFLDFDDFDD